LEKAVAHSDLVPHLFRTEYSKMTAVLCRHFGLQSIEIAEDIASDTFLKASEYWAIHGVPEKPEAWLYTVAKNKTKDYLKRNHLFDTQIKQVISTDEFVLPETFEFNTTLIADSQLAMIFAVCDPNIPIAGQISLALQVLCGFSVEEIANAFLTNRETIKKRLLRARTSLRNSEFQLKSLRQREIEERLPTVLKTLYLLFNEGYYAKNNDRVTREDLCFEAMRLLMVLLENESTNRPEVNALLALMCFQSSRLGARVDELGDLILFDNQDTDLWDQDLIQRGCYYLIQATAVAELSDYHLEAAIAYWHTSGAENEKWKHILDLYDQLLLRQPSTLIALNRLVAYAKVYGHIAAIRAAENMSNQDSSYNHGLLGFLYAESDVPQAIYHYEQAISYSKSTVEKQHFYKEIDRLKRKHT